MPPPHKDIESGTPIYAPQLSPDGAILLEDRPIVPGASIAQLVLASVPRLAFAMVYMASTSAIGFVGLTEFTYTLISVIGPASALIVAPIIGAMSDRNANPRGRRRQYILGGAVATAVALLMLCLARYMGDTDGWNAIVWPQIYTVIFYVLLSIAISVAETPVLLLVADLAGDRQVTGAAIGQAWTTLGSMFVVLYYELYGTIDVSGYLAVICMVVLLATSGVVYVTVHEMPRVEPSQQVQHPLYNSGGVCSSVFAKFSALTGMLVLYAFVSVVIMYGVVVYTYHKSRFFATQIEGEWDSEEYEYVGGGSEKLTTRTYILIKQALSLVVLAVLPLLVNKFGAKVVLLVSLLPQALFIGMAYSESFTLIALIDSLSTMFQGIFFVLLVPVIVHVYGHHTDIGVYVGVLSSVAGVAQLVHIAIGESVLNTDMGAQLPVLLGGIMAAIGLVAGFFFKLTMKSM